MMFLALILILFVATPSPVLAVPVHCPVDASLRLDDVTVDDKNSPVQFPDEQLVLKNTFPRMEIFGEYLENIATYAKEKVDDVVGTEFQLQKNPSGGPCSYLATSDRFRAAPAKILEREQGDYRPVDGYPQPGEVALVLEIKIPFTALNIQMPEAVFSGSHDRAALESYRIRDLYVYILVWLAPDPETNSVVTTAYQNKSTLVKFGVGEKDGEYRFVQPIATAAPGSTAFSIH